MKTSGVRRLRQGDPARLDPLNNSMPFYIRILKSYCTVLELTRLIIDHPLFFETAETSCDLVRLQPLGCKVQENLLEICKVR